MENFLKKNYKPIVITIMVFFVTVSVLNAKNDSATYDEVAHIPASYSYLTEHDMRLNPEHPPLLKNLSGFPLLFLDLKFDTTQKFWTEDFAEFWENGQWAAGKHLLYEAGNDPDQILFWARIPVILISVFLGLFLFRWGKELAGTLGGLFVLTLYAFDPNILGHNHYVTTDIGIATFLTLSFYYFLRFIKDPAWKNVIVGGIFLSLASLVKFSAILAFPIFGLVLITYPLIKKISHDKNSGSEKLIRTKLLFEYLGKGLVALTISTFLIWVVYAFNTYNMPKEIIAKQIASSFPLDDQNIKSVYTNKALTYLNSSSITRPMGEYFLGVSMVFKRIAGGNSTYFLNEVSKNKAWASYFPIVFIIKETIPFLALIVFSLLYTGGKTLATIKTSLKEKTTGKNFKRFLQTGLTQYTLFGFIVLYSLLSITGNLNIGLRHLFPIMPLAYLLVTKVVFDFLRHKHIVTKKQLHYILAIMLTWIIVIPILSYPGYVSYFNETIGGSKNGYKYVTDSNTDWGQDLKRLKEFLDLNPQIDKIRVDYFGGGNPSYYLGEKYVSWWDAKRPIEAGWYAISANSLQVSIYNKDGKTAENNYLWTKDLTPITMIGDSIMIYNVPFDETN